MLQGSLPGLLLLYGGRQTYCGTGMQILFSNAARLTQGYKQRCRRKWGIEDSPFDVSFITPASLIQADIAQACCANSACFLPASSKCARCQVCAQVPLHVSGQPM